MALCGKDGCVANDQVDHACPVFTREGRPVIDQDACARLDTRSNRVREFHRRMVQPVRETPTIPPDDEVRFRLRLIAEEFFETMEACLVSASYATIHGAKDLIRQHINMARVSVNLPEFADGLEDLDYVVEGARAYFGIDGEPIARVVHEANMAKEPAPDGGKAIKPPGWTPPDVATELERQGWTRPK